MTLPDLYLVGAPKAGTTSVASWLAGHPDVFWSIPKEPYYWAADYPSMRAHYGFDTLANYEGLFASTKAASAAVRAEGSTTYLYSRVAIPSILEEVPRAKFVVCLRDPVDLVVSYHRTQLVALNEDEPDFAAAWRRSLRGKLPATDLLDPKLVDYSLVGRLGSALSFVFDHVAADRLHVVLFDELASRPDATWCTLADFVGVCRSPRPPFEVRNRSDKMYRYKPLRRLTHRPPHALERPIRHLRQWSKTTSMPGVRAVKRRMWRAEPRPTVGLDVRSELARHFRSDVDRLAELVGRDLSRWASVSHQADLD